MEKLTVKVLELLQNDFNDEKIDDAVKLLRQDNRPSMSIYVFCNV